MTDLENDRLVFGISSFTPESNGPTIGEPTVNNVSGGSFNYSNNTNVRWGLLAIVVVVCMYLVYALYNTWNNRLPGTYAQRMTYKHFNNLHGDVFDDAAQQTIHFGEQIVDPTAIDHYRLGTVYLVNAGDHHRAHDHFRQALNQVIDGRVTVRDAPFLLDRIDDYRDEFLNFPDIDELPMQEALLAHFAAARETTQYVIREKPVISSDDPDFTQKVMLSRQVWQSDSQNVHDSSVSSTLTDQFRHVRNSNAKNAYVSAKGYDDLCVWLNLRYEDSVERDNLAMALRMFDNNYKLGIAPETTEQSLLVAVWQRIHDKRNQDNFDQLKDSFGDAIMDCVEGGYVVCMAGRSAKVWQTLAHLDFDPLMGIIKNKQTLRNEVYDRAAKIVDEFVGSNGTASDSLKEAYRAAEDTEQVTELIECIRNKIDALYSDFEARLPKKQLRSLLDECKAVV